MTAIRKALKTMGIRATERIVELCLLIEKTVFLELSEDQRGLILTPIILGS